MSAPSGTKRRTLLSAFGAALPALAFPYLSLAAQRKPQVVVVGGGYGGATAAKYLRQWGGEQVDVTLVEQRPSFVSCPMSNLVITGALPISAIEHSYRRLERQWGITFVQATASAVDHDRRRLRLANGQELPYDRLVLSPGIDFQWERIPSLRDEAARERYPHAWKAGPQTLLLKQRLQAMRPGGVFAITIPHMHFRCPPAPYERASLVAAWCRRHNPRAKVLVLDANPDVLAKRELFRQAWSEHYAGIIDYLPNSELEDVAGHTVMLEFDKVDADVINLIPPQRAGDIAHRAGLKMANGRWVAVDWPTLESVSHPGIHVLGDAVFPAPGMPKSGIMANQHGKMAAAAILRSLAGLAPDQDAVATNTCYSFLMPEAAAHITSVHRYDPGTRTLQAMKEGGSLSAAPSAREARLAQAWAANIWADMLD